MITSTSSGRSIIRTFEEAVRAFDCEDVIALDLETTGFSPWLTQTAVIGLHGPRSDQVVALHYPRGVRVPQKVLDWLASFPLIVTHNGAQFDILFMANAGMPWDRTTWYDTLIGEQSVIAAGRRNMGVSLKKTAKRRLGKEVDKDIDHSGWGNPFLDQNQIDYVAGDLVHLVDIMRKQRERASESSDMMRALDFEMELLPIVVQMELNGLPIGMAELKAYMKTIEPRIVAVTVQLHKILGNDVKLTSVPQLKKALQRIFGLNAFPDTKAERFQMYKLAGGHIGEVSELMLEFRNADQRRKMFRDEWVQEFVVPHFDYHAVHGKFWQVGTDTGRFSSSQPNLQQVPRDARHVYGHRPGWMMGKTDYSQIEVRVAAALAGDMKMIEAINSGLDVHTFVASEAFGIPMELVDKLQRKAAKAMNFLLLFGGGLEGLFGYASAEGSTVTHDEMEQAYNRYFERFPGINAMRNSAIRKANSGRPFTFIYPSGLKRVIAGGDLKHTTILNNVVQGTAAFGLKRGMLEMKKAGVAKYLAAVVHDETVTIAPANEIAEVVLEVERCMVTGMEWALADTPSMIIGAESSWGPTWKGLEENETTYSRMINE